MGALLQWLPASASDAAGRFDALFFALVGLTSFVALGIFTVIAVFLVRYRSGSRANRDAPPSRNLVLEAAWIGTPLAIFIAIAAETLPR